MTQPWTPVPAPDSAPEDVPEAAAVAAQAVAPAEPTQSDESAVVDQLEADLSAVEQAIESLERVASEGLGGEQAAAQIAAAVSPERFGSSDPA